MVPDRSCLPWTITPWPLWVQSAFSENWTCPRQAQLLGVVLLALFSALTEGHFLNLGTSFHIPSLTPDSVAPLPWFAFEDCDFHQEVLFSQDQPLILPGVLVLTWQEMEVPCPPGTLPWWLPRKRRWLPSQHTVLSFSQVPQLFRPPCLDAGHCVLALLLCCSAVECFTEEV